MAEIRIKNLVKVYADGTLAVNDISIDVADGEFLVLLGPSGCGKTTTLRCVAGLEEITGGEVWIGDRVVNHLKPGQRDISFVFQFYALYPHLNGYSNIAFPLRATRVPRDEIDRRVREVAAMLRIEHILSKRPAAMSSGEQQRVALGRAVVRRPQAYLMDEPLTNLDAALRTDMRVEIKHLQQQMGTTTLYVTHDQTEAMTMGSRIAVMNRGVLQQIGSPLEVYERPASLFVARFIGDPPMNLIDVSLQGDRLIGPTGQVNLALPPEKIAAIRAAASSSKLVLGVRAESIRLTQSGSEYHARAEVLTREPLGDQTIYSMEIEGRISQVSTGPSTVFGVGERVNVHFDPLRVTIFDAVSEQALV
ncbi:MAG: sn-glycerol-3-phosphate ABC transporter ATP-binding protein UgpC [Anaerolineae bacterium]